VTHPLLDTVHAALREVIDPELGYNVVDLGLIYELAVDGGEVAIRMTTTTPGCPAQEYIQAGVRESAANVAGVEAVRVEMVWDPPWHPSRMSAAAKAHFGIRD